MKTQIGGYRPTQSSLPYVVAAFALGVLAVASTVSAMAALAASIVFMLSYHHPLRALYVLILMTPFSGSPFLDHHFFQAPGAKPFILTAFMVIAVMLINQDQAIKMPRVAVISSSIVLSLLTISVLRSTNHLTVINSFRPESLSFSRYILSDYLKPIIYFLPFIVVTRCARTETQQEQVLRLVVLALCCLSACLLYLCVAAGKGGLNEATVNVLYANNLGAHRNQLATYYILGFPIVLSYFFRRRNALSVIAIVLSLLAATFLYSRTAYFNIPLGVLGYLAISKRMKLWPIAILLFILFISVISVSVKERALTGTRSGDIDALSAGRTGGIWTPLIDEYLHNPSKLLWGAGRYGILVSQSKKNGGELEGIEHPHNMYLEQLIDNGILGAALMIGIHLLIIGSYIHKLINTMTSFDEYRYGVLLSMLMYFLAGLTGRSLFPVYDNSFLWIIMAIACLKISQVDLALKASDARSIG